MKALRLALLSLLLPLAAALAEDPQPVRLAVIPIDYLRRFDRFVTNGVFRTVAVRDEKVNPLADLLMVQLGEDKRLQLVERSELDQVFKELELSASGLVDASARLKLGQVLKAKGLVLVEQNAEGTRGVLRLLEAELGFQAGRWNYDLKSLTLEDVAGRMRKDVLGALPKLTVAASNRVSVSVLRFQDATSSARRQWIELVLPGLFEDSLAADSRVVVLERHQVASLHTEAQVSGDLGLPPSTVLLDGQIALTRGAAVNGANPPLTFTVRLRDGALKEIGAVAKEGTLEKMEDLVAQTAAAVLQELGRIGPSRAGPVASAEATAFRDFEGEVAPFWALETAYALNPKNEQVSYELVRLLTRRSAGSVDEKTHSLGMANMDSREEALEYAHCLKRAADLARDSGSIAVQDGLCSEVVGSNGGLLLNDWGSWRDVEIGSMLQPVRAFMKAEAEREAANAGTKRLPAYLITAGLAFDDGRERFAFMECLLKRWADDPALPYAERMLRSTICLSFQRFDRTTYNWLAARPEPELRFAANVLLYGCDGSVQAKHRYAVAAVRAGAEAFDHVDFVALAEKDDFKPAGQMYQYFRGPLCQLLAVCPEEKPKVAAKVMQTFGALLDKGDLNTCVALAPHLYRDLLAPADYRVLVERILDLRARYTVPVDKVERGYIQACFRSLEETRAEWTPPVPCVVRVLLTPESRELATLAGGVTSARSLTPQRLLLDGSTLWVGMLAAGTDIQAKTGNRDGAALLRLDLSTGKLQALRFGEQAQENTLDYDAEADAGDNVVEIWRWGLVPMCRWGDRICVGQAGRAVYLFPAAEQRAGTDAPPVLRLAKADGIPETSFVGLAAVGDHLYIASQNLLMKWNPATRVTEIVANTSERLAAGPLKGRGILIHIWGDPVQKALYAIFMGNNERNIRNYTPGHESWRMNLADSTWQQLPCSAPNRYGKGPYINATYAWDQERVWLANPGGTNAAWILFDAKQQRFAEVAKPAEAQWTPWLDVPKEAMELCEPRGVKAALSRQSSATGQSMVDAVPWENGTIAIACVGKGWEIRHYTRQTNAVSASLAWAPLVQGAGTVAAAQAPP